MQGRRWQAIVPGLMVQVTKHYRRTSHMHKGRQKQQMSQSKTLDFWIGLKIYQNHAPEHRIHLALP